MDKPTPPTPSASAEIGQMFKLDPSSHAPSNIPTQAAPQPVNLPIADTEHDVPVEVFEQQEHIENTTHVSDDVAFHEEAAQPKDTSRAVISVTKKVAPYVLVFAIGVGLYYFYFNDFSWNSLFQQQSQSIADKVKTNAAREAMKKQEAANYQAWIAQFFFDVSDPSIIDMETDVSGNGLANFDKYLLNLNPKVYDSVGDGIADGQKVMTGINPWTGLAMTDDQQKIADTFFDKDVISSRLAEAQTQSRQNTAFTPYVSDDSPYFREGVSNPTNGNAPSVPDNGAVAGQSVGTPNTPNAPTQNQSSEVRASNNSVNMAPSMNSLNIDTNIPGRVDIPSVGASVPIIWSKSNKDFDADLKKGVVHYPGTPLPGTVGTSYISGHSSGYFYDKSAYKQAFAQLGNVKNGAPFSVTVTLVGGKKAILHYRVDGRAEYAADDQRQFLQSPDSVVALSTCWPINTTARRLVLFGVLTSVDK